MLLSIDRVLQLISEGKTTSKIAEMANCSEIDVIVVINQARDILNNWDKQISKKKIIIKKKTNDKYISEDSEEFQNFLSIKKILKGSELSAVPMESSLIMYVDGSSYGNPGPAGIGILIHDRDDRQIGKVSLYIGEKTEIESKYYAIIKALKIAEYFQTNELKIRTDSDTIIKQISGEKKVEKSSIKKINIEIIKLRNNIKNCKIEYVTGNINEKAGYLSRLAASKNLHE